MEEYRCPRCNEPMDEGHVSFSGSTAGYVSKKQTGMLRKAATIKGARACPNCGYVELYLDPKELKQNIRELQTRQLEARDLGGKW